MAHGCKEFRFGMACQFGLFPGLFRHRQGLVAGGSELLQMVPQLVQLFLYGDDLFGVSLGGHGLGVIITGNQLINPACHPANGLQDIIEEMVNQNDGEQQHGDTNCAR